MIAGTIALKASGQATLGVGGLADVLWRNLAVAAVLGPLGVGIGALGRNQIVTVVGLIAVAAVLEPQSSRPRTPSAGSARWPRRPAACSAAQRDDRRDADAPGPRSP